MARDDYATAARYLQPTPGVNLIEAVKQALALRSYFEGDLVLLSDEPNGTVEAGLPPGEQRVGTLKVDGTTADLILVRVDDPAYGKIWLVSSESVAKIPQLYALAKSERPTLAERFLPDALSQHHVLGVSIAQWIGWLLSIPVSWMIAWLLAILVSLPRRLWNILRKSLTQDDLGNGIRSAAQVHPGNRDPWPLRLRASAAVVISRILHALPGSAADRVLGLAG